ncbi:MULTISPECIES: DUF6115 domain-containing protein [unclassified Fusibacter]|uniref:DUF6115 domain-containing protein n=1 Tax=unclassified Fusibacter TaxID=2624464 RepID=UPI001013BF59|nr:MULTISPECIES: hypothetical protein [unclassified Fusibacter]MCK8058788.1 hypothetical protein [Fusibacter sp. A2]NPE21862.1 hypothetical protein [Fusibacter sp. A1]
MMEYSLILIGIGLVIAGLYQITRFLMDFSSKLVLLDEVMGTEGFDDYQALRLELDELNYSYYEILSDLEERMSLLEDSRALDSSSVERQSPLQVEAESNDLVAGVSVDSSVKEEKTMIQSLIDQGFGDAEIAKILNVGTGKVALIRKLYRG